MRRCPPEVVRAIIARAVLGDDACGVAERVGSITLRPHQRAAVSRLRAILDRSGGAMLADRVGLGKTFVATALAAECSGDVLIVAPASLREMWRTALAKSGVEARIISHEALSRGAAPAGPVELIVVDEAHRFRSPHTRRYATLADCCRTARVLLLTATPVQNSRADLSAQLALFLGRRAWLLSETELAAFVVRGADAQGGLPRLVGPRLIELPDHGAWLERLLALPPPLPARDEGLATTLLAYGLVHQWSSSRAALIAALQRRRARAVALAAALEQGRSPTRAELAAWSFESDAVQLAFAEIVTSAEPVTDDLAAMRQVIDHHREAVEALLHDLRHAPDPDVDRAERLRALRAEHPRERILAFCQYTETAVTLGRLLSRGGGVATLTARGARIASGRIFRAEVLAQFTPGARDVSASAAQRIDLLIATDLLSEGLNLQEASVVVHLDLPWNPARLEQRVGRVHRIGSRHEVVSVYSFAPPAPAERMLEVERRLIAKLRDAQRTIGVAGQILPSLSSILSPSRSPAEEQSALRASLEPWLAGAREPRPFDEPIVAAVESDRAGALACVEIDDTRMLVALTGRRLLTDSAALHELVTHCGLTPADAPHDAFTEIVTRLETWMEGRRGAAAVDLAAASAARARRVALDRVSRALARTPRHRRAQLAPLADAARAVATASLGEGAERILETLVASELPDEAWLRSIATFGELNARDRGAPSTDSPGRIVAVLLLVARH